MELSYADHANLQEVAKGLMPSSPGPPGLQFLPEYARPGGKGIAPHPQHILGKTSNPP